MNVNIHNVTKREDPNVNNYININSINVNIMITTSK